MAHKPFNRIVDGANTAVLFIHGIIGTPDHFRDFIPLVPETVSVSNLLLEGHGQGVKEFSAASMEKWKRQIAEKVQELAAAHDRILIVAHSMGTLFAIRQAVEHPDIVRDLFLLAAPLKIFVKPKALINSMKVYIDRIDPSDTAALAAKAAYGISGDKRFWRYLGWIPRYLELFAEIRRTRDLLPRLAVPCRAFQSRGDELVSISACKLLEQNRHVQVNILENSSHYYYAETDREYLLSAFCEQLKKAL